MPELPSPLHPALVHFPIALAVLLPFVAAAAAVAIARRWLPLRVWAVVVLLHALVAGSAYLAEEIGHREEEKVEDAVPEPAMHEHEEAGEWVVLLAALTLPISAAGLLAGRGGGVARGLAVLAGLALAGAVVRAGQTGGELVYRHGGASVYREAPASP